MTRTIRRALRIVITAGMLVALAFAAQYALERMLRKKSVEALANFCGPQSKVTVSAMDVHVFAGNLRWTHVRIEQPADSVFAVDDARTFHITGTIDTAAVEGLSLLRMLLGGSFAMQSLRISHPDLRVHLRNDTLARAAATPSEMRINAVRIMALTVEQCALHVFRAGHAGPVLAIEQFDMQAAGAIADFGENDALNVQFASVTGEGSDIAASLSPLYDLQVACIALAKDGAQLQVTDATLRPRAGPENYGEFVQYETDLVALHADTLLAEGLAINASIAQHGLRTAVLRSTGVNVEIHHDKTLPDEPYRKMPLPLAGLRALPYVVNVDSLQLERWRVHYHERGELGPDYGEVLFSDISGSVTGLNNTDTLGGNEVHLVAQAKAYDQALVSAEVRTSMTAPNERFTLSATIGAMPIEVFNRMTTDLVAIQATAGRINNVNYRITGDDDHATGRVDVSYQDLEISALKQDGSGDENRLKSSLLNLLVRSKNLRAGDGLRHGDFAFDREKDRAVFKYIWTGVREGMLAAMLPGALDDLRKSRKPDPRSKR